MLTQYNLKMPHAVYGGENAMDNITAIIKARGAKKVAMFTDKGIEGAGLFALPENAVKAAGAEYYVLDDLPPEPTFSSFSGTATMALGVTSAPVPAVVGMSTMGTHFCAMPGLSSSSLTP